MELNYGTGIISRESRIKDGIIIAIENKGGIYNSETLEKIKGLTKDLQKCLKMPQM